MKITVLGSGGWGTALALLLLDNGNDVTLWSFDEKEAEVLRRKRENPLLAGVPLPEALTIVSDLDTVPRSGLVVLATPSFAVRATARRIAPLLAPGTILVSVAKGIEKDTNLRLTQIIEEETGGRFPVVALSGPSHAEEVGRRVPTGVVAACRDLDMARQVQDVFMSPRFRVYTNTDVVGVELGAALKNILALCCGISDGMGLGDNTKALLMTRGMTEMARLGVALGGRKETFAGLSGMGDLIVTCTSMHSRNRRAGILIGQGKDPQTAMKEVGAVVEGYYAAKSAYELGKAKGIDMPITDATYKVLYEGADVREAVQALLSRQRKSESEDAGWQ